MVFQNQIFSRVFQRLKIPPYKIELNTTEKQKNQNLKTYKEHVLLPFFTEKGRVFER